MILRIDLDLRITCGANGTVSFWGAEDWVGSLTELDFSLCLDLFLGVEDLLFPPLSEGSRLAMIPRLGLEPLGSGGTSGLCSFLPLLSLGLACDPSGSFAPGSGGSIVETTGSEEKEPCRPSIVL